MIGWSEVKSGKDKGKKTVSVCAEGDTFHLITAIMYNSQVEDEKNYLN